MKRNHPRLSEAATEKLLVEFARHLALGDKHYVEAGKIAVLLVDDNKFAPEYVLAKCPYLSATKLRALLALGRGELLIELMVSDSHGDRMLAQMSIELQKKYVEDGEFIPLVIPLDAPDPETGETTAIQLVSPRTLTQNQRRQVSRRIGKRTELVTLDEQKSWLRQYRVNTSAGLEVRRKWVVSDLVLVVPRGCTLTLEESRRMTFELERSYYSSLQEQPEDPAEQPKSEA